MPMSNSSEVEFPEDATTALPDPDQARDLAASLLNPRRKRPVVLLISTAPAGFPGVAAGLRALLGLAASVVEVQVGPVTDSLRQGLPVGLWATGNACRIYWPGLSGSSDPHDHPYLPILSDRHVDEVVSRVEAAIVRGDSVASRYGPWSSGEQVRVPGGLIPVPSRPMAGARRPAREILLARVQAVKGKRIDVMVGQRSGRIACADEPLVALAARLQCGDLLEVLELPPDDLGQVRFTTQGMTTPPLPKAAVPEAIVVPAGWSRFAALSRVGDVRRGRIVCIKENYLLVEVFPQVCLLVLGRDADPLHRGPLAELFEVGESANVRVLELDDAEHRGRASITRAYLAPPEPFPGLEEHPYLGRTVANDVPRAPENDEAGRLREQVRSLESRVREMTSRISDLKRENQGLAATVERASALRGDPLQNEPRFLAAVREAYASKYGEADRFQWPLQRMRLGKEFLARLRERVKPDEVQRVIHVMAEIACDRARANHARAVHHLRCGDGGSEPQRQRRKDGAKAWRCSIEDGTPSARRLHWWVTAGNEGKVIEFASVNLHDETDIPE